MKSVHNLLMKSVQIPLYLYLKDGIYLNYGPLQGTNLTKSYIKQPLEVLEYLDNVLENDNTPYKLKVITREVIQDLKNNQLR